MKYTKIICTLGPASQTKTKLSRMLSAGMDIARLNFSHGTLAHHRLLIRNVRAAAAKLGKSIAIIQDLQGPRVRLGVLPKAGVLVEAGQEVILAYNKKFHPKILHILPIDSPFYRDVRPGHRIFLQDGLIQMEVTHVRNTLCYAHVKKGGTLFSHKGLNAPDTFFSFPSFTSKDKKDLLFGLRQQLEFVALSFVQRSKDVDVVRRFCKLHGRRSRPHIIVKIERPQAVEYFDEILDVCDAVMIARGDLGIEIPLQDVPIVQKDLITRALRVGKPTIIATHMLESMIEKPRPTRAEVSDIASAVVDHADAVMLSGETANGKYPVESVRMMHDVIIRTEASRYNDLPLDFFTDQAKNLGDVNFRSQLDSVLQKLSSQKPRALFVFTPDGQLARMIARYRPEIPLYAVTHSRDVYHTLFLSWATIPILAPNQVFTRQRSFVLRMVKQRKLLHKGSNVTFIFLNIEGNLAFEMLQV
ncbi:MAG: pyruvate kinase [Candidatus Kerfeldbacteria bacterium RIFCSPHIGHO2_02_FULL_42_14]|uniref:Pyruvate kinase n=1 Tax=Candidatus Kerfeldbacteria bacterium RIFCSPHIGHO2_02_FULL_42_14 TaxID=1798540 RepID=A0A1G2AR70_9BACT|nr:MAG: pyruvate kinase [Candidatus Kerfeldbacteria bacterium RIFCSPHIGHO2_02_FULL_42_14]OGY81936.1 MAG: pyruvate kinase [Candidatus Kerfeldbacteria bacterium RIFCSPHIGHO2_12_FULL_42_13]OGY83429.1 MAG: pyruvate kinase [Candidatus Kerfeldbacteria bacterium RIFCSPLOWO2_02_FULL_42_19]OGY85561.1 MAG: pyruvate kinase [Candidatus Kerfeldbacteria bacterium RIFCSPLOWO2_12_FULL_43_9]